MSTVPEPNPEIFEIALHRLNCTTSEAIVVGDSPYDAIGAGKIVLPAIGFAIRRFFGELAQSLGLYRFIPDPADLLENYVVFPACDISKVMKSVRDSDTSLSGGAVAIGSPIAKVKTPGSRAKRMRGAFGKLGPGIVTGASDDDPSGIATYSQVGAQFGFAMLDNDFFLPLMAGIQEISAWIGRVTGMGIAANIRRHYSAWVLYPIVVLMLVANIINLGADIGAMGSAFKLLVGGSALLYAVGFGLISGDSRRSSFHIASMHNCSNGLRWCCWYTLRPRSRSMCPGRRP